MKKLEAELRSLRLQMEEDFLITNERFAEMQRSMGCVEASLEQLNDTVADLKGSVHQLQEGVSVLQQGFREFAAGNRTYHEGWHQERKRNLHVLDVLQASLLTSGLETESRLDQIEARLRRLEEQQPGAA